MARAWQKSTRSAAQREGGKDQREDACILALLTGERERGRGDCVGRRGVQTREELALIDADDVAALRCVQGIGKPLRGKGIEYVAGSREKKSPPQRDGAFKGCEIDVYLTWQGIAGMRTRSCVDSSSVDSPFRTSL